MCSSSGHHSRLKLTLVVFIHRTDYIDLAYTRRLKPTLAFIYRTVYSVILQNAIKFMHDIFSTYTHTGHTGLQSLHL